MAFVKLDCNILNSTIWYDFAAKNVFLTALLMSRPRKITEPLEQIEVETLDLTGFVVPPGEYGFVEAAGIGIVHLSGMNQVEGIAALKRLCSPEADSRSPEFDGRRMARVNGGYLILNHKKYHDKDHTSPERSARWRKKQALLGLEEERRDDTGERRDDTQVIGNKTEGISRSERGSAQHGFAPPTYAEVEAFHLSEISPKAPDAPVCFKEFVDHFESNGWLVGGKSKMVSWKASYRNFVRNEIKWAHT